MSEVIGHDRIIERLRNGVPQVSLFQGERSVGKWTTALWLRDHLGILPGDLLELRHLNMDAVREAVRFLKRAPFGERRMLIAYLGGVTWQTQTGFLQVLEMLPPTSVVVFVAPPDVVSPALLSRTEVFDFSLLRPEDVKQILMGRNFKESTAEHLAELSGGRVTNAIRLMQSNEIKITVLGAVRSLLLRDAKSLDTFAGRWSDEHTELLATMCRETISGRHVLFTDEETEALGRKLALKILTNIRTEVRPRLVVHSQLMTVLKGE